MTEHAQPLTNNTQQLVSIIFGVAYVATAAEKLAAEQWPQAYESESDGVGAGGSPCS